jgi:hypothetical protein
MVILSEAKDLNYFCGDRSFMSVHSHLLQFSFAPDGPRGPL